MRRVYISLVTHEELKVEEKTEVLWVSTPKNPSVVLHFFILHV